MVDSIVGPILTVMMSLSSVALIFCGPVYCCNSTTVGVEDQCNYDDVNMIIVMRVEIMIMIGGDMILLMLSKVMSKVMVVITARRDFVDVVKR